MIIYNVTVKVDHAIAGEWLSWLLEEHAPAIVATACFTRFTASRLLDVDDTEGPTYTVQYFSPSLIDYQRYLAEFAEDFQIESYKKWGHRFIAFRSLMEVVN